MIRVLSILIRDFVHRLSTIKGVNRILVMHKGQIVEEGTHAELIAKKGIYYRLYLLQYKGQEISADGKPVGP